MLTRDLGRGLGLGAHPGGTAGRHLPRGAARDCGAAPAFLSCLRPGAAKAPALAQLPSAPPAFRQPSGPLPQSRPLEGLLRPARPGLPPRPSWRWRRVPRLLRAAPSPAEGPHFPSRSCPGAECARPSRPEWSQVARCAAPAESPTPLGAILTESRNRKLIPGAFLNRLCPSFRGCD